MASDRAGIPRPSHAPANLAGAVVCVVVLLVANIVAAQPSDRCVPAFARVVSVQGNVEVRRAGSNWLAAELHTTLCAGDMVRVHQRSRAALLLSNETTLRLDQGTALTLVGADDKKATLLEQISGGLLAITRTPRPFKIKTPFVNANVEGTEFAVRVEENNASIAVYEGQVVAENDAGSVALASGESAFATRNAAPTKAIVIRPVDAVAWTLYFPSVFDYRLDAGVVQSPGQAARRRSIELYRKGQIAEALAELDKDRAGVADSRLLTYRAGLLLLVGRLDEAKPEIERALRADPNHSDAHALLAVIAVAQNDKVEALERAKAAVALDTRSSVALIALSYAQQAQFLIDEALASVRMAVEGDRDNALAWSRLAELEMSVRDLDRALAAAQEAVKLDPSLGRTQTVLGFANLVRIDTQAAKASFERAIELDSADPLPRLGLGLAKIREGDLVPGRVEIEIATILDPRNSLVRSYLGKAYYEEKRDALAGDQLVLAKEQDPKDPTPHFYDAIRKQADNRPVEALLDLNRSVELNDNRAVNRSRLLMDDDKAARTAGVAAIYGELGFEKLAAIESVKALSDNVANDAAHRQLAAAYANLPRHDIARVSESLQAQLRQPLTSTPIDPRISTDNLVIVAGTGPTRLGAGEYNTLFSRDEVRLQVDGVAGSRGTLGDQLVVSGLAGKVAWAASQLHYETDGFSENNRLKKNAYDAFVQVDVSPMASIQVDLRRNDFELANTYFAFDPNLAFPVKIKEENDAYRLGGRIAAERSDWDWIWSVFQENRTRTTVAADDDFLLTTADTTTWAAELQHTRKVANAQIVAGAGHIDATDTFPIEGSNIKTTASTLYIYSQWAVKRVPVSILLGLSHDRFRQSNSLFIDPIVRRRFNPKLGFIWSPEPGTTLRAAATSSVKRPLVGSQTVEPTQVMGFNQFFTGFDTVFGDRDGTVSQRGALALDQRLSKDTFAGIEVSARRMRVPNLNVGEVDWRERGGHAYLYRAIRAAPLPRWQMAVTADFDYERIIRPQLNTGAEGIVDVRTRRLPFGVRLFDQSGLAVSVTASHVKQSGVFSVDINSPTIEKADSAWIADLSVDYRLPRRLGVVSFGARNLFDSRIDLFETDPFNPRVAKRRLAFAKLRITL